MSLRPSGIKHIEDFLMFYLEQLEHRKNIYINIRKLLYKKKKKIVPKYSSASTLPFVLFFLFFKTI